MSETRKINPSEDLAPRSFQALPAQKKGLIVVYTGDGKGKTTAAMGAAFRSLGRGMRVAVVQFIKGSWVSGEVQAFKKFGDQVSFFIEGDGFTWDTKDLQKDVAKAEAGWERCRRLLAAKEHDLFIFDEILYVLKYRFLDVGRVAADLDLKDPAAHVILTGRDAPPEIVAKADLVTEMKEVKHPYAAGIPAQPGIDF